MSLYTISYWNNVNKELNKIFPKNIVEFIIIPKIYICLERLRFDTYIYIKNEEKFGVNLSKYIHPLIFLGSKSKQPKNIDKILLTMNYHDLINIKIAKSPICLLHYYYWKKKKFQSNYNYLRKGNNLKNMWNKEEIKEFNKNDKVTIVFPKEEKNIEGYIIFDDIIFENKRKYIGLSKINNINYDSKVEIFDIHNVMIYKEKIISDDLIKNIHGSVYKFNYKMYPRIYPWEIENGSLISITYFKNKIRDIEIFRFLEKININNFTEWIVINKFSEKKRITLTNYKFPQFYKIEENIKGSTEKFLYINCTSIPEGIYYGVYTIKYSIKINNNKSNIIIPKLINSTLLGYLGRDFIIENKNIYIISFFQSKNILYEDYIKDFVKRLKNIFKNFEIKYECEKLYHIKIIFS